MDKGFEHMAFKLIGRQGMERIETPELNYNEETFRDMYEALKAVDDYLSANYPGNMLLKQIAYEKLESALSKAEGK